MSDDSEVNTAANNENEVDADAEEEVKDATSEENTAEAEGEAEADEEKSTAQNVAAGVGTKTEESIHSQRRHFPGKTTSNIFG
ncbi:hypothetical protein AVEN_222775-1 [Araneus ventricosus]|uniref:Uncharacterized protein n=1 Tax=Araneus ventricosus TaxID=182803 RepID=A0A4Y2B0E5_ARAVE|nr:hypothetical protein AVEN_222775-1 [Araneus ventricosus]